MDTPFNEVTVCPNLVSKEKVRRGFVTLQETQRVTEALRKEYIKEWIYNCIGDVTSQEFINSYRDGTHVAQESTSLAGV